MATADSVYSEIISSLMEEVQDDFAAQGVDASFVAQMGMVRVFAGDDAVRAAEVRAPVDDAVEDAAEAATGGERPSKKKRKSLDGAAAARTKAAARAMDTYVEWLGDRFEEYQALLAELVVKANACLKIPALDMLFKHLRRALRTRLPSLFARTSVAHSVVPRDLLARVINAIIGAVGAPPVLADADVDAFAYAALLGPRLAQPFDEFLLGSADDLRAFVLQTLAELPDALLASEPAVGFVIDRLQAVAGLIPATNDDMQEFILPAVAHGGEPGKAAAGKRKRKRSSSEAKPLRGSAVTAKDVRKAYERAWRKAVSAQALTPALYKAILETFPETILANVLKPLTWLDFLAHAYEQPGIVAVLALSGMHELITKYNLEYPQFYAKLYSLLTPAVLYAKYRARFFKLVHKFMRSTYLPHYLVAAFIKRLARLALSAPPQGALLAIQLIFNMMTNNPATVALVHRPEFVARVAGSGPLGPDSAGADPFDESENDPAKTNAQASSLWELQALEHHYSPTVARSARVFRTLEEEKAYKVRKRNHAARQTAALDSALNTSYATLIAVELKHRPRVKVKGTKKKAHVAVALSHIRPRTLFSDRERSAVFAPFVLAAPASLEPIAAAAGSDVEPEP
ncbi:CBF/Mak21 family protein [Thecamonas trahens ATCC 50062]|uniref:CBF/Mak21 family protein n=1 Tax=Thecamonas trahens ATCC 50062 TaxID=461836 RepID=A0A0L0DA40_THETB|nr:CBF/Mak21 family protein [Thecamonas trahens ATCC 50062]KNC48158.1 CBF/Mak21 family protein [Thecamonas trahens ATCC 50062]|eukprot:XP_013758728.1 CBF/Mak21 family protein [Thecamonas trahens ATCC 50062]